MGIRVTIVLDESNAEKLRNIQAKLIKSSSKSVSFSYVLNRVVEEGLKKIQTITSFSKRPSDFSY